MSRLLSVFVAMAVCVVSGPSLAHTGAGHYREFSMVFNGYGDDGFRSLCECISSGIDNDLPAAFRKVIGPVPGNHRVLGHGWTLDAAIPEDALQYLEATFPGKRQDIIKVWAEHAKRVKEMARSITGLPPASADSLAAILHDIHLLGDMEPGNVITKYVLPPKEIEKHLVKELRGLFRSNPEFAYAIESELKKVVKMKLPPKLMSETLIDTLARCHLGEKLHRAYPGMKIQFSEKWLKSAEAKYASRILGRVPGVKDSSMVKPAQRRFIKKDFDLAREGNSSKSARKLVPGLLTADRRLLVALKGGVAEGLVVFAIEGGLATYSYVKGNINNPEFQDKLVDAAIKGVSVGGAVAVAVMLGAGPGGWVVLGVSIGAYEVCDFAVNAWRRNQARKHLTFADLEPFGIVSETTLDLKDESLYLF